MEIARSIAALLTWQWLILILALSFQRPLRGLIVKKEDRVEAKLFVLRDAQGNERAKLGLTNTNSTNLSLYDPSGKERASIFVLPDGTSALAFYDNNGEERAVLATGLLSSFHLVGPDGTSAATLLIDGTDRPEWEMVDPRGLRIT